MKLNIYYKTDPPADRWFKGDNKVREIIRRIIRGKKKIGGVDLVFINLCKGLKKIGVPFEVNTPFNEVTDSSIVCVIGRGRYSLEGYSLPNPVIAGIGLMTHPLEWPDICKNYPIKRYLQHSKWANDLYKPYFGEEICKDIWPVGIDTNYWTPSSIKNKKYDFLIYNKIKWNQTMVCTNLLFPIKEVLKNNNLRFIEIKYGEYEPQYYKKCLDDSNAMIFISEHESQGLAYQEALSCNIPVLAWNPGRIMDPQFIKWGDFGKKAESVPIWDESCGITFKDFKDFAIKFPNFICQNSNNYYMPRLFIMNNLTLEQCAFNFFRISKDI